MPVHCVCGYTDRGPIAGLGDVVELLLHKAGIATHIARRWKNCNCKRRREALNRMVPL
jgi:hypothetical protein